MSKNYLNDYYSVFIFSVFILLMIVFYSFSIIGMEVFTGKNNTVFPGCWSVNNTMKACMPILFF